MRRPALTGLGETEGLLAGGGKVSSRSTSLCAVKPILGVTQADSKRHSALTRRPRQRRRPIATAVSVVRIAPGRVTIATTKRCQVYYLAIVHAVATHQSDRFGLEVSKPL